MKLGELIDCSGSIFLLFFKFCRILLGFLVDSGPVVLDVCLLEPYLHLLLGLLKLLIQFEKDLINLFFTLLHEIETTLREGLCGGIYFGSIFDQFFTVRNLLEVVLIFVNDKLRGVLEQFNRVFRALLLFLATLTTFQHAILTVVNQFHAMIGTHIILQRVRRLGLICLIDRLWLINDVLGFIKHFKCEFQCLLHIY